MVTAWRGAVMSVPVFLDVNVVHGKMFFKLFLVFLLCYLAFFHA
jgi:hypothetical protein